MEDNKDYIIDCGKCRKLFVAQKSQNKAAQFPERASIAKMMGMDPFLINCPHCHNLENTSMQIVEGKYNMFVWRLENKDKVKISDLAKGY